MYSGRAPSPRAAHAAAFLDDKCYIFGGRFENGRLNDLHCFDCIELSWKYFTPVGALPVGKVVALFKQIK